MRTAPTPTLCLPPPARRLAQEFLKRFAPHQGMLNPPEFPSNYLKTREVVEGAAVPDKLAFNFFVPHETMCQSQKVRAGRQANPAQAWPCL